MPQRGQGSTVRNRDPKWRWLKQHRSLVLSPVKMQRKPVHNWYGNSRCSWGAQAPLGSQLGPSWGADHIHITDGRGKDKGRKEWAPAVFKEGSRKLPPTSPPMLNKTASHPTNRGRRISNSEQSWRTGVERCKEKEPEGRQEAAGSLSPDHP